MFWNQFLFVLFPYIAITLSIVVTIYRSVFRPFTVSSLSSQLLEHRWLYWGNIAFHYGILFVLSGHLVALLLPQSLRWWNAIPARLLLLEVTGLGMGLWALAGALVLVIRRATNARIRIVTTPMDWVVWIALLVSLISGVLTATLYRFGSQWFTGVFTPYLWSVLRFNPEPERLQALPWLIQLHAFNFFVLLALFPFSRLVHIITLPLGYLLRPWQIVIAVRKRSATTTRTLPAQN